MKVAVQWSFVETCKERQDGREKEDDNEGGAYGSTILVEIPSQQNRVQHAYKVPFLRVQISTTVRTSRAGVVGFRSGFANLARSRDSGLAIGTDSIQNRGRSCRGNEDRQIICPRMSIMSKFRRACERDGFSGALRLAVRNLTVMPAALRPRAKKTWFDEEYGVDTDTWVEVEDLGVKPPSKTFACAYAPVTVKPWEDTMALLKSIIATSPLSISVQAKAARLLLAAGYPFQQYYRSRIFC